MLVMGGTRTSHRLACAIEDSGFIIKDTLMWLYGSGFPKAQDLGKMIDKRGGQDISWFIDYILKVSEERGISKKELTHLFLSKNGKPTGWLYNKSSHIQGLTVEQFNKIKSFLQLPFSNLEEAKRKITGKSNNKIHLGNLGQAGYKDKFDISLASTDLAKHWDGFKVGGIKPAYEPIIWAVKPPEGSYVDNVLKWGVGAVNVDECRVAGIARRPETPTVNYDGRMYGKGFGEHKEVEPAHPKGRFPANVILDEEAGRMLDEQSGTLKSGKDNIRTKEGFFVEHGGLGGAGDVQVSYGDSGGASRFFYCAKASRGERNAGLEGMEEKDKTEHRFGRYRCKNCGKLQLDYNPCKCKNPELERIEINKNVHPTVKPIKLFEWLIRLVTREGQVILDPFIGSGTTAIAAHNAGRKCVGIEKEDEYIEIAKRRTAYWRSRPRQLEMRGG